ncbi:MAG: hypothetical protein LBT89_03100 [Planctomycetaceae bacterium]|jgi:tetratricopeptide (TPR) repeat protein|nr:hypothetical protein [Planctomycetaceae bacterium]
MLLPPELLTLPVDFDTLAFYTGLACAGTAIGAVFTHDHSDCPHDISGKKQRIAELEKTSPRTLEQNDELADLYMDIAGCGAEDSDDFDSIIALYDKAEAVIKDALAQGEDTELQRKLANAYLNRAVALNDYDLLDDAAKYYQLAVETLSPLDAAGDGEATYDLAGVKLNLGIIYRENGELEQAKTILEDSFLLYRKIEKIGLFDTRYYMATTSVQQGGVLFEMHEPLDKITDAYNRAMRLLVEVIEDGQQLELERDLADTLLDRCAAIYHDILDREFDSVTERDNKIGDILIDVGRSIELLEKQFKSGNEEARADLFNALIMQSKILMDIEKLSEGRKILDRAVSEFPDYASPEHPMLANEYAVAYESRAECALGANDADAALADFSEAVRIREELLKDREALDPEDLNLFIPQLAAAIASRATVQAVKGDKAAAVKEIQRAMDLLNSLNQTGEEGELIDDVKEQLQEVLHSIQADE